MSPSDPWPKLRKEGPLPLRPLPVRSCLICLVIHRLAEPAEPSGVLWGLPTQCRSGPGALASPRNLLVMQNLKSHLRPTESESAP